MNKIKNFFQFLEDKEGEKFPLKWKLLHDPDSITPEDLNVRGQFSISESNITSLPDNLQIESDLWIMSNSITSLPDNLKVGRDLWIKTSKISSIPNNLQVKGTLYLINTSLSQKYSEAQIIKMIEDKGGYVGSIYL